MRPFFCPAHLLAFDKPFADHLINCGFHKPGRDRFPVPVAITIIGNESVIGLKVVREILYCLGEFGKVGTGLQYFQLLLQGFQLLQRFVDIAVPQRPFEPLQQSVDSRPGARTADT